jgi:serine/threonine protein kinase
VPDHELLGVIGRGAYGEVRLARNAVGTPRAVKVVHRQTFERDEHFEREFKGLQQFEPISRTHDGLMDILHLGRPAEEGWFYYVMELADDANAERGGRNAEVPGSGPAAVSRSAFCAPSSYVPHTLREELRTRGALPIDRLLELGLQLSAALEHLHRHGLVHRDVKPSNVIFVNGEAKLADAGLVARMDDAQSLVGTAGYIAPEGPGTPRGDIYGLGKLLCEAAFGKDRQEFPQLPSDLGSHPDHQQLLELNEIIVRACAHDAELRYRTALELQLDLDRLRQGKSVRRHHQRQTVRRQLRRSAPVGALLLLGAGIMALWWRQQQPGSLPAASEQTIFVLPFRHSAPGPTRAESWELPTDVCLCGRLTDAFIDSLPLIPGIRTGPRKSGWIRHAEDQVRRELVRTNDTRYILTGRVDHTNDALRLVLRLYERQQEIPIWTETFAGTTNEVPTLEQRAINAIARRLDRAVPEGIQRQIDLTLSNNLAAYGLFQRARSLYVLATSANLHQALADYLAALDAHPRYTAAMVGIMWLRGEIGFD